jgi:hypothetical protein
MSYAGIIFPRVGCNQGSHVYAGVIQGTLVYAGVIEGPSLTTTMPIICIATHPNH